MKKIHILVLAIVAVLSALSAIGASSAFAALEFEPGVWLINGGSAGSANALAEGELLLEDNKLGIAVICSGMFNGHFEAGEPDDLLIIAVFDLGGKEFSSGLTGEGILCRTEKGCENSTDIEVWPENLPWLFLAELDKEDGKPWVLVFSDGNGAPGYEVMCLIIGTLVEELCEAAEGSGNEVMNATGGVSTTAGLKAEPNGPCTTGGAESGVIAAFTEGLLSAETGTLSISTPPE
jgi:hypothetical protein